MYTDVYVDVLFLINFSMDAISLFLTSRLCSLRLKVVRVIVSAAVGALYSVVSVFWFFAPVFEVIVTLLVSLLMVFLAFDVNALTEGAKYTAVLFVSSSLLGGIITALYSMISNMFADYLPESSYSLSPFLFALLVVISVCAALFLTRLHGSGNMPKKVMVRISLLGKNIETEAIVDSGNLLVDPLSRKNVIIIKAQMLRGVLSDGFIRGAISGDESVPYKLSAKESAVFRLIPANSIGGGRFLYGVRVECVKIYIQKKNKTAEYVRDGVLALSGELDNDVNCILPAAII